MDKSSPTKLRIPEFTRGNIWYGWLIVIGVLGNLYSLNLSPLPWFDEAFFADVSMSVAEHGKPELTLYSNLKPMRINAYGPVYFYLQAGLIKVFGLDIFWFRLVNYLAGLGCVVMLTKILRLYFSPSSRFFECLLLFDPIFIQNIHSGRMDMLAMLFGMGSLYVLLKTKSSFKLSYTIFAGLLLGIAYLTTPRMIFFALPVGIYVFIRLGLFHALVFSITSSFIVLPYIIIEFGSIISYFRSFLETPVYFSHIGVVSKTGEVFRYWHHGLIYIILIVNGVVLATKLKEKQRIFFIGFLWLVVLLFHLLVIEKGPYSAMVIPFYYLLIAISLGLLYEFKWIKWATISSLCITGFVFLSIFFGKLLIVIAFKDLRNPTTITNELSEIKIPQKRWIASYEYYYASRILGYNMVGYELPYQIDRRIQYHLDSCGAKYMLINKKDLLSHHFLSYLKTNRLEKLKDIHINKGNSEWLKTIEKLIPYNPSYEGALFKIIENEK